MPRLIALIGPWLALAATNGLAFDSPLRNEPSDAAPLAPMTPLYIDSDAAPPAFAQEAMEGATTNLSRDILRSQTPAAQKQSTAPFATQPAVLRTSASEGIGSETRTRTAGFAPRYATTDGRAADDLSTTPNNPLQAPLGGSDRATPAEKMTPTSAVVTVGSSLAIVLGLFFFVAWAMRKAAPRGSIVLPNEVFEILGKASLGGRQQVQLVRCGNKLVLLSITPGAAESLTEVTDPLEVDRLAGLCRQAHPRSSTKAFQQVFQQLAPHSGSPDPIDELENLKGRRRKSYRWESEHV